MVNKQIIVGLLVLTFITAGVYIELSRTDIKMRVDEDYTTLYTYEGRWLISGREYNSLFNGSKKLNRILSQTGVVINYDNLTKITNISRHTTYSNGATIDDTYVFDGKLSDKERFPISHTIHILNAKGLIYEYTVDKLVYGGITEYLDGVHSKSFGRNVKVSWDVGNYYSRIYKYSGKDEGKLTIKYRITNDDVTFNNRLFDPDYSANNGSVLNNTLTVLTAPSLSFGTYSVYINCTDESGNVGKSEVINVTIEEEVSNATILSVNKTFNSSATKISFPVNLSLLNLTQNISLIKISQYNTSAQYQNNSRASIKIINNNTDNITLRVLWVEYNSNYSIIMSLTNNISGGVIINNSLRNITNMSVNETKYFWLWGSYLNASLTAVNITLNFTGRVI